MSLGMRASDSPRWCATCQTFGDHHTDRHEAPSPAGKIANTGKPADVSQSHIPEIASGGTHVGGPSSSSHEEAIVRLLEAGDNMADALEGDYADIWDGAVDAFNDARAESS